MDTLDLHFALMQHRTHSNGDPNINDAGNSESVIEDPLQKEGDDNVNARS